MAKHKRRYNLRRVRLSVAGSVGAIASLDVGSFALTGTPVNPTRLISLIASFATADQVTTDDGLSFGVAHGDYTNAEIEECLEATNSINPGDKITRERANRLVRLIGIIQKDASGTNGSFKSGAKQKIRLNWPMAIGQQLVLWFRNGSSNVYTTGTSFLVDGDLWVKDGF